MSNEKEDDLKRIRAIRSGNRGVVTKYTKEVLELLKSDPWDQSARERLSTIANLLNEKLIRLKELDAQVLQLCDVNDIEQEIEETEEIYSRTMDVRREITKVTSQQVDKSKAKQTTSVVHMESTDEANLADVLHSHTTKEPELTSSPSKNTLQSARSKLPKLVLPKFKGDITNYRTFWQSFESAVHNNTELATIDKFNYLFSLLEGQALRSIKGLAITEDNYQAAVHILQERFGKSQQIISAHMDELLKIPPCVMDKPNQLRFVYDKVSVNVRGLEALGVQAEQYGSLLIPVIMSKLPSNVRLQIARNTAKDVWVMSDLLEIIKKEVEARELSEHVKTNNETKKPPSAKNNFHTTSSLTTQGQGALGKNSFSIKCAFCGKQHYSASCETVVQTNERRDILRRDARCFVCLRFGHRSNQCFPTRKCRRCDGAHHQSICDKSVSTKGPDQKLSSNDGKSIKTTKPEGAISTSENTVTANQTSTTATTRNKSKVFLQTATTYACSQTATTMIPVRVLTDSGSQRSDVTDSLKERLGLVPEKTESLNLNTFGDDQFRKRQCDRVRLQLQRKTNDIEISALCFPKICSPLTTTLDIGRYPHLEGLVLADKGLLDDSTPNIDILIGSDYYFDIIMGEVQWGDKGPVAVESEFGWLVSGNAQAKKSGEREESASCLIAEGPELVHPHNLFVSTNDDKLTEAVREFWNIESIGILEPSQSIESEFLRDLQFDEVSQRYQVSLPWKQGCMPGSSGYSSCVKRLRQVHSRLKNDQELLNEYDSVIQQQLDSGTIERVSDPPELDGSTHYLPHHRVVRHDKLTTKVRVVFDGSAKHGTTALSINKCLEKGPNLVPRLFDVLVKFRGYPIGIMADVEKAFHQIQINPDDRRMLRFLWFDDIFKEQPKIVQYQFCRLVFGLTPSPTILSSLIQHHLEINKEKEPHIASLLQDSFYVDDFVGGATDDRHALEIYEKSSKIMKDGGFTLRK